MGFIIGIPGITGQVYFDKNHNFTHPLAIGIFENAQFISAPVQFQPITPDNKPDNLAEHVEKGNVVKVGDDYLYKTRIVYVGIDINEFDDIDVEGEHTYLADFYLWFRYQGEKLNFEEIIFDNAVDSVSLSDPIEKKRIRRHTLYALPNQKHFPQLF